MSNTPVHDAHFDIINVIEALEQLDDHHVGGEPFIPCDRIPALAHTVKATLQRAAFLIEEIADQEIKQARSAEQLPAVEAS